MTTVVVTLVYHGTIDVDVDTETGKVVRVTVDEESFDARSETAYDDDGNELHGDDGMFAFEQAAAIADREFWPAWEFGRS